MPGTSTRPTVTAAPPTRRYHRRPHGPLRPPRRQHAEGAGGHHRGHARRRGPRRASSRWPRRWPGPSSTGTTWWSRPAPAPARPSPTWCRPSCRAARPWWPPPPRRCRTSSPARTCPSSPSTSTRPFDFAVLKGRSNYVCLQRIRRGSAAGDQLALEVGPRPPRRGDRRARRAGPRPPRPATGPSSTASRQLPGVGRGQRRARASARAPASARRATTASPRRPARAAADADVVVVNTHLYGMHLATGGAVLPEHDLRRGRRGPPARGHRRRHRRASS